MATYKAKSLLFVSRLIQPGEQFTSDQAPGQNWEPVDAEAIAAVAARDAAKAVASPKPHLRENGLAPKHLVDIPADWKSLHLSTRRALARKLGALPSVKLAEADAMIEQELAARAQKVAA